MSYSLRRGSRKIQERRIFLSKEVGRVYMCNPEKEVARASGVKEEGGVDKKSCSVLDIERGKKKTAGTVRSQ